MPRPTAAVSTISGINRLPEAEKQAVYSRLIPPELLERFQIPTDYSHNQGGSFLKLEAAAGRVDAEMALYHQVGFPDPVLFGHITDTLNGQVHVLIYILNDPDSPRFNVDRLQDGTTTQFGTFARNLEAELAAMEYGLAPGQIRSGMRLLGEAINAFEKFVASLGNTLYFADPLYYHNAVIFERYGFAYSRGRRLMERIAAGFAPGSDLHARLDGSNPFRRPEAANSIRLRSWAIHDGILDSNFDNVTMYKRINQQARISTSPDIPW